MLLLLSISLSMDAFAVAAAHGLNSTRIPILSKLIICAISIIYFGISVLLGGWISSFLSPAASKIIGIILMLVICFWMLIQVLLNKKPLETEPKTPKTLLKFDLKQFGLTFQIIRNPILSDIDKSHTISPGEAVFLGTALSVDSISVGIGYSLLGGVSVFAPLTVGLCQFLFLWVGNWLGLKFASSQPRISNRLQIVSVAVMFILALVRIFG